MGARLLCFAQAASLSPLEAEPITVASISVPLRTTAPLLSRSRDCLKEALVEIMRSKQAAGAHKGGALRRFFLGAKPQKRRKLARSSSASASRTSERSYQVASKSALNIQRRPGLLAHRRTIEPRQSLLHRRKVDHFQKLIETRFPRGLCAEVKDLLSDPPKCHDPLQSHWPEWNHGPQSATSIRRIAHRVSKHFGKVFARNRTKLSAGLAQGRARPLVRRYAPKFSMIVSPCRENRGIVILITGTRRSVFLMSHKVSRCGNFP
jgi:hypothetical protein